MIIKYSKTQNLLPKSYLDNQTSLSFQAFQTKGKNMHKHYLLVYNEKQLSALTKMNSICVTIWLSVNSCSHYEQFPAHRYDKNVYVLTTISSAHKSTNSHHHGRSNIVSGASALCMHLMHPEALICRNHTQAIRYSIICVALNCRRRQPTASQRNEGAQSHPRSTPDIREAHFSSARSCNYHN